MGRILQQISFLVTVTTLSLAKDLPELPLCPTSISYFPQMLPMHCRMPPSNQTSSNNIDSSRPKRSDLSSYLATMPTFPPAVYQSPPPGKVAAPIPLPPGFPAPIYPPPQVPPIPVMPAAPAHKLPVIVMPFYAPDPAYKNSQTKKPRYKEDSEECDGKHDQDSHRHKSHRHDSDEKHDSDCDKDSHEKHRHSSSDDGSSEDASYWKPKKKKKHYRKSGRRSGRGNHKRVSQRQKQRKKEELLTPLIQYVTKDGYVIFEKEITRNEAKDWLEKKEDDKIDGNIDEESQLPPENNNNKVESDDEDYLEDHLPQVLVQDQRSVSTTTMDPVTYSKRFNALKSIKFKKPGPNLGSRSARKRSKSLM